MNKLKFAKLNSKLVYILFAIGAAFAAMQCFMVMKYYDADVFLYAHGTTLPTVFGVVLSLFVIAATAYLFLCSCEGYSDKLAKTSFATRILSLTAAIALVYTGMSELKVYNTRVTQLMYVEQKEDKFIFWSSLIAFGAFIYFLVGAIVPDRLNKVKTLLGSVTLVWHVLYLLSVYFDMTSP